MKTKIFALLMMLTMMVTANAKGLKTETANVTLSGTILDALTNETLAGVEVSLEGTNLKAYTDFDGNFSFENVTPGTYKVVTNYVSYQKSDSITVQLHANEMHALNINLHTSGELVDANTVNQLAVK